jgi:hypothetical protein
MAQSLNIEGKKIRKYAELVDGKGNKLNRKVHLDSKGLYVINNGMKGRLVKTVRRLEVNDVYATIRIVRKVSSYEAA